MPESYVILLNIFSFSFLVALTGAMAPGPLLTYTIIQSSTGPRGYLMALPIIAGHALVEFGIMILLFTGFSFVLTNIIVMRAIGITGGLILVGFGYMVIRDVLKKHTDPPYDSGKDTTPSGPGERIASSPVLGGALVSMSNPYWWVWWATIGLAFMVNFEITPSSGGKLAAFYIGHELGDLFWYLIVSILSFYGIRRLTARVYNAILSLCGIFMVGFGVYLGIKPFLVS